VEGEEACKILHHVLTIEEVDWLDNNPSAATPPPPPMIDGSWRLPVLNLIIKIYQKICPQVSKALAPSVTKVYEYFVQKVLQDTGTVKPTVTPPTATGEKKYDSFYSKRHETWDAHIVPDLKRCDEHAKKMPFFRTRNLHNEHIKKEIETKLEELAREPPSAQHNVAEVT
jgi:hypothetical protein